ncbi:MAG: hypothetical protein AABZ00_03890 [Chloroflexota bacterium]
MLTHTPLILKPSIQALGNSIGVKVRNAFRELEVIHMYKRDGKMYTFDIPFSLKMSKNGDSIIVVVDKVSLPRTYSPQSLIEAKDWFETSIGMPIEILDGKDVVAICCQFPNNEVYSVAV